MAKLQRWRRIRSTDEGTPVGAVEPEDTSATDPDDADPADDGVLDDADEFDDEFDGDSEGAYDDAGGTDEDLDDEDARLEDDDLDDDLDDEPDDEGEPVSLTKSDATAAAAAPAGSRLTRMLLGGRDPRDAVLLQLVQAGHVKQAVTTALAMGVIAAIAGRPARESAIVLLTVLVGQTILGWHNDIVDRQRDHAHGLTNKPLAMGYLKPDTVWYSIVVATLLLIPLAITTGIQAGCLYLASVAIGMLGNVLLRTGVFSWWSWAASFALLPAYLSYGGWGGQYVGSAPQTSIVVLAALLGVGVHFMRAVWGLVADHEDGWTYLPLKLGMKLGATRLLALSTLFTAVIAILLAVFGAREGLSR